MTDREAAAMLNLIVFKLVALGRLEARHRAESQRPDVTAERRALSLKAACGAGADRAALLAGIRAVLDPADLAALAATTGAPPEA